MQKRSSDSASIRLPDNDSIRDSYQFPHLTLKSQTNKAVEKKIGVTVNQIASSCDYHDIAINKEIRMYRGDENLVRQTLLGDRDAFSLLVRKYQGMVCGLVYHKVGNFEDAQELAQEAFLNAYRDLHRLKEPGKFSHWLYSITLNTCASWFRKRRLDTVSLDSETCVSEVADTLPTPEETVVVKEQQDLVHKAMANLPEPHRLAVTLYYMDGLSVGEVSAFLDIPAGTVKSRLHKARKQLKGDLITMVEQTFAEKKPGDEFTKEFQERIDIVLAESTEILTGLLQKPIPDADDIQRVKSMVEQFAVTSTADVELKTLWQQIFDSVLSQDRKAAFDKVMQLLYQSADLEMWGWQPFAIATLDVLKMAEEDEKREPNDINVLMGYMAGQHASDGRFEWRSSDWHCMSWGDIGLFEGLYRKKLKIPVERLEVGSSWRREEPMSLGGGNRLETTIEADDEVVTVPAGRFTDCLCVSTMISSRRRGMQKDLQHQTLWMAPGIGVVKFTSQVFDRPNSNREIKLKEYFIPESNQDYFPLLIGSRWHYEWDDPGFNAPTAEVYRLLCQKGEDFYFSRARYIYGNYADSEVGKMVAARKKEGQKD